MKTILPLALIFIMLDLIAESPQKDPLQEMNPKEMGGIYYLDEMQKGIKGDEPRLTITIRRADGLCITYDDTVFSEIRLKEVDSFKIEVSTWRRAESKEWLIDIKIKGRQKDVTAPPIYEQFVLRPLSDRSFLSKRAKVRPIPKEGPYQSVMPT